MAVAVALFTTSCEKENPKDPTGTVDSYVTFEVKDYYADVLSLEVYVDDQKVQTMKPGDKFERSFSASGTHTIKTVPVFTDARPTERYCSNINYTFSVSDLVIVKNEKYNWDADRYDEDVADVKERLTHDIKLVDGKATEIK